jgi:UDP-N-acetyl-D-glucosamine dehydrogenase
LDGLTTLTATTDASVMGRADVIVICVPTPLTRHREPDLSYIRSTAQTLSDHLRPGQLIILESTTYPGTSEEVLIPILEQSGHSAGDDFFVAHSPEREDPGNPDFNTQTIPKVVGGTGPAGQLAHDFYSIFIDTVVGVSDAKTAEAVKLTENIFRSVNIALVNELKVIYDAMDIDIWEVVDAAATKPFGYMPFYPGPGLGGHCIPIDPYYLSWKAREHNISARFIELSGEVIAAMPSYVLRKLSRALESRFDKPLSGANILVLGIAYKKNVDDLRESPALKIIDMLCDRGAHVDYHDPYLPAIPKTREFDQLEGMKSVELTDDILERFDAGLVITGHDDVDYTRLLEKLPVIIDSRNVFDGNHEKVIKA